MVIIKHNGGWSASNDAQLNNTPKLINTDEGKKFKDYVTLDIKGLYTVSGGCSGNVLFAMRDDVTNELKGYSGVVLSQNKIEVTGSHDTEWLKNI